MNFLAILAYIGLGLVACIVSNVQAGGDKSARTTVITLAGSGEKHHGGGYIPIPVPVCTGGGGHGHGRGYGGGFGQHHHYGAQSRMGWRR